MAEKEKRYTEEQKEILHKGFQEHDFTQNVSLSPGCEFSGKEAETYKGLKTSVKDSMKNVLSAFGIHRKMDNYSKDHPVNLLMNSDASYIAEEATKILGDEQQTDEAVDLYFDLFGPLVEIATDSYCKAKGKRRSELTAEDRQRIMDRVTQVVNEELSQAVMEGQQFSELFEIAHDAPTHEDFSNEWNPDSINFHDAWTHCKTQVGEMLSLDEPDAPEVGADDDVITQMILNAFCERLDDVDATIFHMREDGYTQAEIAKHLRYKNHSAVTKRIQSIRKQWDEFTKEYNAE